ncbi:diacylglycerol kinase [Pararhodobacter sp.]|uniref:diacylglycerol kinase n=1 Tax=Pararhodobacter sp. TaxID=2127056 RepID=UPI002AFFA78E|nr:diacylglycerol kinase [Pararhodobacter sp.]
MTKTELDAERTVIPPRGGLLHVVDAAGYSVAGARRLWAETAARLEILAAGIIVAGFLWQGAVLWQWLVVLLLFALTLVVEALNTAIEVLTDRVSPEWSQAAKDAKDLGSLAVGLMLMVCGVFAGLVIVGVL